MNKRKLTLYLKNSTQPKVFENPAQVAIEPNIRLLTVVTVPEKGRVVKFNFNLDSLVHFVDDGEESMISIPTGGMPQ